MVHVKGSPRRLTHGFSRDFAGRAVDFPGSANRGLLDIFAFCSLILGLPTAAVKREKRETFRLRLRRRALYQSRLMLVFAFWHGVPTRARRHPSVPAFGARSHACSLAIGV